MKFYVFEEIIYLFTIIFYFIMYNSIHIIFW